MTGSIAPLFRGWDRYNAFMVEALRDLTPAQLALSGEKPEHWPIWAIAAHTAGARTFWLCGVFGEPGADTTPFPDSTGYGWEDEPDHPRDATEVVWALESTWRVVEGVLDRWTVDSLEITAAREGASGVRHYTRQGILMRMLAHDAYHAGELSMILGANGLAQVDLWPAGFGTVPEARPR